MPTVNIPKATYEALKVHAGSERRSLAMQLDYMLRTHPAIAEILLLQVKHTGKEPPGPGAIPVMVTLRGLKDRQL